jgi:hypothetical protein
MRSDSAIKSNSSLEYGWHSDFHTADNAAAVKDLCLVRLSCVLGAMIALGSRRGMQPAQAVYRPNRGGRCKGKACSGRS